MAPLQVVSMRDWETSVPEERIKKIKTESNLEGLIIFCVGYTKIRKIFMDCYEVIGIVLGMF
jgi:hypothetical protein